MKNRKKLWISLTSIGAVLTTAMVVGTMIGKANETVINQFLKVGASDSNKYTVTDYADFKTGEEETASAKAVCQEIEEEGITLLKNDNNALPLASGSKVTLLGQTSNNFVSGGTGSSSSSRSDDTPFSSLKDAGLEVNPTMNEFYTKGKGSTYARKVQDGALNNVIKDNSTSFVNEVPMKEYSDTEWNSIKSYGDAAIIMIGRIGGEGSDVPFFNAGDGTGNQLELTSEEKDLLSKAKALKDEHTVKKIVVVLNMSNPIELDFLNKDICGTDYGIDAALWIGETGSTGICALGEVLAGKVNPSGKLVDTYCYDNLTSPAMQNTYISAYTNGTEKGLSYDNTYNLYYEVYQEGIYVGYRYYETRYEDYVLDNSKVGNYEYSKTVCYPFGYGLSYSTFEYQNYQVKESGDNYIVSVDVKNKSDVKGKDVVEVYLQNPYTNYDKENNIEKSSVSLVGFAKVEVNAGETQKVTINVPKSELKTYDANGNKTYILEEGKYYFSIGNGAHDALNNILALKSSSKDTTNGTVNLSRMDGEGNKDLAKLINVSRTDTTTYSKSANGTTVTNQFDHADLNKVDDDKTNDVRYVTRNDWAGSMPQAKFTATSYEASFKLAANDTIANMLKAGYVADTSTTYTAQTYGKDNGLKLVQFKGVALDGSIDVDGTKYTWDDLVDEMTFAQQAKLIGVGFHTTAAVKSISKPVTHDENGAQGFTMSLTGGASSVSYPSEDLRAATFNIELYEKTGVSIGNSAYFATYTYSGIYAPNANIHRTPYGGRNFEYYSEDPFLSGKALAYESRGIQSKGVYVYMKHFALNDQETGRDGISVWANEQSIREIYLKPFQMAIEESDAHCVMTSFNRIGAIWAGADKNLLTNVLKGEFGMDGMAITDYSNNSYMDVRMGLQAGSDIWDCSSDKWQKILNQYKDDPEIQTYMRRAVKSILYTVVNSNATAGVTVNTVIEETMPWWMITLIIIDSVLGALTIASLTMLILNIVLCKKETDTPVSGN